MLQLIKNRRLQLGQAFDGHMNQSLHTGASVYIKKGDKIAVLINEIPEQLYAREIAKKSPKNLVWLSEFYKLDYSSLCLMK